MIELNIELEQTGKTLHFEFTHDTVKKFASYGGDPNRLLVDPIGSLETFIRATLTGEGSVSASKAEKLYDDIDKEYEVLDVLGRFADKYNEVFIGGDNAPLKKKLSDMK